MSSRIKQDVDGTWGFPIGNGEIRAATRFEVVDVLMEISKLVQEEKVGAAFELIGMSGPEYEDMPLASVAKEFQTLILELSRFAGIELEEK